MQVSIGFVWIGFLLGALIGFLAWRMKALSANGAWAASLVGGMIFGVGGWKWAVLLLVFFILSSILSRSFSGRKAALSEKFSKGSQRDWGQVLANGGLGAGLAGLHGVFPDRPEIWVAFVGAMAAVNADTWATELGVLSSSLPRLVTTGKSVVRGTSGGVTFLGYQAVVAGAALIALLAAWLTPASSGPGMLVMVAAIMGGVAGSTFDSILGATVQAIYSCPACQKETEHHPLHSCGTRTSLQRGWRWLNNDLVNFACSLVGAAVAAGLWALYQ